MPSAWILVASSGVDHGCPTFISSGLLGLVAYGDYQVSGGLKKGNIRSLLPWYGIISNQRFCPKSFLGLSVILFVLFLESNRRILLLYHLSPT